MIRAHHLIPLLLCFTAASARTARAETYDWNEDPNYEFTLWIDDGQEVVYGLYVVFNESAGDTREYVQRARFVDWARSMGFGTIGTRFDSPEDNGEDIEQSATLIRAIENFAAMSGHPELVNAPILTDGLSLGGFNSMRFAALYPERVIGYQGGGAGRIPEELREPAAARVPGLIYRGDMDSDIDDALDQRDQFLTLRAQDTQIAFWVQWGWGHARGTSDRIGWKILSDMVALRYPVDKSPVDGPVPLIDITLEEGWLAEDDTWETPLMEIRPYSDVTTSALRRGQFWLPSRDSAFVYRAQGTRDASIAFVQPPGADPRDQENGNYLTVDPGDAVPIEVSVGELADVAMVEVFDGSALVATLTGPPYQGSWKAAGIGMHALVAVATLANGSRAGGLAVPVMVRGFQRPGTRTGPGGGGDGGDDGGADDGSDDDGGADDDGDDDDSGADGADGGGSGGGCGCRSGAGGAGPLTFAVLVAAAGLGLRRRRASRCS